VVLAGALALAGAAMASVPAPKLAVTSLKQLPTPLPYPYDDSATPAQVDAQIDAAFARARASGKRVVIDLGGNWCSWCRMLSATMALPEAKPFIDQHFEVVDVEVTKVKGKNDRNLQVLKRFHLSKVDGYPWVIVADADGKVLASSYEITDDNHQTPQQMVDWLAKWAKQTPAAQNAANGSNQRVAA